MASRKVNVAVVGLGFMGLTHLRAYQRLRHARIVAVCGRSRLPVNGVIRGVNGNLDQSGDVLLGPGVKVYRDFPQLLADPDIDLVDLCTPTAAHASQVIAALQAGKHVVCEKPLAQNTREAKTILQVAARSKTFLMPAMCMRFWPGWSWLKEIVTRKKFGPVLAARFRRTTARPAWSQAGSHLGGALLDLHIHDTDFVNFLFGRPSAVFSTGVIGPAKSVDHIVTQYFYPHGPAVYAEGSWLLPDGFNMTFTLHCQRATIDFDFSRGPAALQLHETGKKPKTVKLADTSGYNEEIAYFVSAVAQGKKPVTVTPLDGLTALEICAAEEKSIRQRALVKL